ncbi:hypothetical protein [Mesorhizobium sp.]|uniref:hypothetical protein n=1 Tax=Mesorhizobium sp. TaxID=1871066 RepID=UPI000FE602F8|nr:hypothetical protein [Mesorhizobium sp.]RWE44250.1 MAG: hypothetical protein EOS80_20135 [Mesorhizobium sp.]
MDERTYQVFHQHMENLAFFSSEAGAAWATGVHVKQNGYTEEQLQAVLAEVERQKVDTSPMVHLTQHQLDELLASHRMPLPVELGGSENAGA